MFVLAIDTSTLEGAVGFIDKKEGEKIIEYECPSYDGTGHAETLALRIERSFHENGYQINDVDLIAFGIGPGSFTGIRIGMSLVKGLAIGLNVPAIGISSLEATALTMNTNGRVAAVIDAKRKELFGAVYDVTVKGTLPVASMILNEQVAPVEKMLDKIVGVSKNEPVFIAGNGIEPYQELFDEYVLKNKFIINSISKKAPGATIIARAGLSSFLKNSCFDIANKEPTYLRAPDAKLPDKT